MRFPIHRCFFCDDFARTRRCQIIKTGQVVELCDVCRIIGINQGEVKQVEHKLSSKDIKWIAERAGKWYV
jgi:hypothetical protein